MASDFERSFPGASALATECVLNLAFLSGRVEAYGQAVVRTAGVPSLAAFNVLTILDGDAEPLPPSTIAERMILRRSTMVEIVRSLERRRLIRRFPHPQDGRMVLLEITAEGRERVSALRPQLHEAERRWMRSLSESEQRSLLRALAKIQANAPDADSASAGGRRPQ